MRLRALIFLRLRTAIITIGVSRYSLPSLWGRGKGGGASCCCFVVLLLAFLLFLFAKLITIPSKTNIFSGYTSSKFCKDARNQLSHRKIVKSRLCARGGSPHLTPASATTRPKNEKVDSDNAAEKIAITQITNHKIIIRNFNTGK